MQNEIAQLKNELADIKAILFQLLASKNNPDTAEMIGVDEAARICGFTVGTMYAYLSQGKMDVIVTKVGKRVTMKKEDVISWNASRMRHILR